MSVAKSVIAAFQILQNKPEIREISNKWITDDLLTKFISKQANFDSILNGKPLSSRIVNRSFSKESPYKESIHIRDKSHNQTGLYLIILRKRKFYYIQDREKDAPDFPTLPTKSKSWIEKLDQSERHSLRQPRGCTRKSPSVDEDSSPVSMVTPNEPRKKKHRLSTDDMKQQTYWDSKEAAILFGKRTEDESTRDTLEARWDLLKSVGTQFEFWRYIVEDNDTRNLFSKRDVWKLQHKARLLAEAYHIALAFDVKNETFHWGNCCKRAIENLERSGSCKVRNEKTVMRWNREFRHKGYFSNHRHVADAFNGPLLFRAFPETKETISSYIIKNLTGITSEEVHHYIHDTLLEPYYHQWLADTEVDASTNYTDNVDHEDQRKVAFFKSIGYRNFCHQSTLNIMNYLGFKYSEQQKSYYVDGHERDDVVKDRNEFLHRYLTEYEPRCLRWVQLTTEEVDQLRRDFPASMIAKGYHYSSNDGTNHIEFHVDDIPRDAILNKVPTMSVRCDPGAKPIMLIGQDECVFQQFLLHRKQWQQENGEKPLLPKTTGEGIMISAFQSRETGFGLELEPHEIERVNELRRGKHYESTDAAMEVLGKTQKPDLEDSPLVKFFQFGSANDGYWNSNHIAIQFEDVVDVLKSKFGDDAFEFVFLFDHSQGHDKKRMGGLDARVMRKGYGGVQPKMRDTVISEGCLGKFDCDVKLNIGDVQCMVFKESDDGPYWMDRKSRELNKYDRRLPNEFDEVTLKKEELRRHLTAGDIPLPNGIHHTMKELLKLANGHGIPTKKRIPKIVPGWCGKPKGMQQVLYERGLLDPKIAYTMKGRKDPLTGKHDTSTSLVHLMSSCTDFKQELTELQALGKQLGVTVDRTPKYHAEIAGEGIEYSWAFSKQKYRSAKLKRKKGREKFKELVRECLSTGANLLSKEKIARFSRRARSYMCTYWHLEQVRANNKVSEENIPSAQKLLFGEIERLSKNSSPTGVHWTSTSYS